MSASMVNNGLRSCDCHECSQMNELKVNTSFMNMIAGWHLSGDTIMIEQMPIMGGYVSSVEETAICDVAATLASFVLYNCDIHLDGPVHIRWGNTSNRECLQVAAHAARALDANTDVLLANQYYTIAGPCTEMCLLEVAAQAIVDTVSGRELLSGVAPGKGVLQDRATGLEARMLGEASSAACGMSIEAANGIVDNILHRYELNYHHAPMGKKFQECYNLDTLRPSQEYLDIYENSMHTISLCGMDF